MASVEHEAITGVWGGAHSGVQGQSPWSGGQGGEAPLKLKAFCLSQVQMGAQICQFLLPCKLLKNAFWATVCKTVGPMLLDRCLSVCPVCDVGVLWLNGWMDQHAT